MRVPDPTLCKVYDRGLDRVVSVHTEVMTPEDFVIGRYDASILGPVPNGYQYGYCSRCLQPFVWSVPEQRWKESSREEIASLYAEHVRMMGERVRETERQIDSA